MVDLDKIEFEKRTEKISLLVFHCFALSTPEMLTAFRKTGTSVHYIIMRHGTVLELLEENKVAYHAGISSWREFKNDINAQSIGIELQNSTMGNRAYTKAQIESLINLSKKIIKRYKIKSQNIVGHSDIAPLRKPDPGKFFPWEELAKNGIGIWKDSSVSISKTAKLSDSQIEELLANIGYNTADLTAALYAFALHFMPKKIAARDNIIQAEAETAAFWRGKKTQDFAKYYKEAPKIYPPDAENLLKDKEVLARLQEIAEIYANL